MKQSVDGRISLGRVNWAARKQAFKKMEFARQMAIKEALTAEPKGVWYEDLPKPKKPPGVKDINEDKMIIPIKKITSDKQTASVYTVLKVSKELVTVKRGSNVFEYELPSALLEWASIAEMEASRIDDFFPCEVEFGNLNGRIYAEFLGV